jgi:hypothetical protein
MIKKSQEPPRDAELPDSFHGTQGQFGVRLSRDARSYAYREQGQVIIRAVPSDRRIEVGKNVILVGSDGSISLEGSVSIDDLTPDKGGEIKIDTIKGDFSF